MAIAQADHVRTSYEAVLAGEISAPGRPRQWAATALRPQMPQTVQGRPRRWARSASAEDGQDRTDTPPQPVSRISKDDTTQECWCGCQELTSPNRRWRPGHDQRGKGIIKRAVKEGKVAELSPQLREYGKERGLL